MLKLERLFRATLGSGYDLLAAIGRRGRRAVRRHRWAATVAVCLFVGFAAGVLWPLRGPWPPAATPPAGSPTAPAEDRPAAGQPSAPPASVPAAVPQRAPTPAPPRTAVPASPPPAERLESAADFQVPLSGKVVAGFGWRRDPVFGDYRFHPGVDLQGRSGQSVAASAAGRVTSVRSVTSDYGREPAGWEVTVEHPGGWLTRYRFSGQIRVGAAQPVGRGEALGTLTEPCLLHFSLYRGEQAQQPALSASSAG